MEIEPNQADINPSKISQPDETGGWNPVIGGVLGCFTAFFAYPMLHAVIFRILVALHVFRVTDAFESMYSNVTGQVVLIWSLHVLLIAAFAILYYSHYRKGRKGDLWRSLAACALVWQILAGSIFAFLLTVFANSSGLL